MQGKQLLDRCRALKIVAAYCYPTTDRSTYDKMARRFADSYIENPPGEYDHRLVVLVNGPKYPGINKAFDPLPVEYLQHDNSAKDLGAYIKAAYSVDSDLLVCLGAPVFFHKAGWLDCMAAAYFDNGPGMFGVFGAQAPLPHLRTTGFGISPELLRSYPYAITTSTRYQAEHGPDSLSLWVERTGFNSLQVAWTGVFSRDGWHQPLKKDALMYDQHSVNQYGAQL